MPRMSGAEFMADTMKAYGVTHIFFVPTIPTSLIAIMLQNTTNPMGVIL